MECTILLEISSYVFSATELNTSLKYLTLSIYLRYMYGELLFLGIHNSYSLKEIYINDYNCFRHVYCGMLHCQHQNERLEFGMESVSVVTQTFLNKAGFIVPCRTAIVDLGLNEVDPGLAPDGAKCGENMLCVNQKCMSVSELRAMGPNHCPDNCNGNGVCNSKGQCHCHQGYAPPTCESAGPGGSHHSGPASDSSG